MLKMLRRKPARDRTGRPQHDKEHQADDKADGGAMFEVLPPIQTGRSMLKSSSAPAEVDESRHSSLGDDSATCVSFITFKDAVDLQSPMILHEQPLPALVYTAGGKAKSMYTVARPASVRRCRDSVTSPASPIGSPITGLSLPLPALKLPSVKARHKQIPTFNLCIAGAPSSGKTSFIRLLCETLDIDKPKDGNREYSLANAEISEPPSITITTNSAFGQRIRLTLFETEPFTFGSDTSQNLHSDLKANEFLRFIESRLDASIAQESALVRQPLTSADSHIHACIYFLDQTCFTRAKDGSFSSESKASEASDEGLRVAPHHLNVMRQIGKRVNIIPIIARADELSIAQLNKVKTVINQLCESGTVLNPRIFSESSGVENEGYDLIGRLAMVEAVETEIEAEVEDKEEEEAIPAETPPTKIVRSRSNSIHRSLPRRKTKRFSAIAIRPSEEELDKTFPVSFISPENFDLPSLPNEPESKEGAQTIRYQRKFRYGCVDIENEEHCEFSGLRKILFTTGWKTLKESTKLKFERYRTERLEQRQARSRANTHTMSAVSP